MKKLLAAVLVLMSVFTPPVCVFAEAPTPAWFELNSEQTVLTITLPANPSTGYAWEYTISDKESLVLIEEEYIPDESSEQLIGSGGTWVASFVGKKPGDVKLTLSYKRSGEDDIDEMRGVDVQVSDSNQLTIPFSSVITEVQSSWYELSEGQEVLTIRLPANPTTGYAWEYSISDEGAFELLTQEYVPDENAEDLVGAGGTWAASFIGTAKISDSIEITLNYKRDWEDEAIETRRIEVLVSENNRLEIVSADIVVPAQ